MTTQILKPLINSQCEAQALELFDKFNQYFCIKLVNNLYTVNTWFGNVAAMRSGEYRTYSLLGQILAEAHHNYLPDRKLELGPIKESEKCSI